MLTLSDLTNLHKILSSDNLSLTGAGARAVATLQVKLEQEISERQKPEVKESEE